MTDILVQGYLSDWSQRILLVWPGECGIKDVDVFLFRLFRVHDLEVDSPGRILASLNRIEKVLHMMIWLFACEFDSHLRRQSLDSCIRLDVPFHIFE